MNKPFERVQCWNCQGYGVVDRGYHCPDECSVCNGTGSVVRYAGGTYAAYQGGPLLGRERRAAKAMETRNDAG